jgi:hypothetical protein
LGELTGASQIDGTDDGPNETRANTEHGRWQITNRVWLLADDLFVLLDHAECDGIDSVRLSRRIDTNSRSNAVLESGLSCSIG